MREMKDSGIEWIGKIPKDWNVYKLKKLCSGFTNGTTAEQIKEGETLFPVTRIETISSGTINWEKVGYLKNKASNFLLKKNDILISNINSIPYLGNSAVYDGSRTLYHGMNLLKISPDIERFCFFEYYFKSIVFKTNMQKFCKPAINQASVSSNAIKNMKVVLPSSLTEQKSIKDFLDNKCSKIDLIINYISKQIDILENYKKSLITEVITKGINKNKSFNLIKFKYIAEICSNLVTPDNYPNYYQISPENIEKNTGKIIGYNTVYESGVSSGNHLFYEGQILYSKIRPKLNKVCIAPFKGLCSADMYPIKTTHNTKYLLYIMLSEYFLNQIITITEDRVKMPKINQEELGNVKVPFTFSNETQLEISNYLDIKCSEIDSIIANKQKQLEILKAYKKSLIYEYVTGKKEIVNE